MSAIGLEGFMQPGMRGLQFLIIFQSVIRRNTYFKNFTFQILTRKRFSFSIPETRATILLSRIEREKVCEVKRGAGFIYCYHEVVSDS